MPDRTAGRRRFLRAALLGSLAALALDACMLMAGHGTLTHAAGPFGSFFDVQGRALLDGHLHVDPAAVSFEGFVVGGRTYIYFGPVPALLRLPVLAVTHGLDGRLTQLSMLLAFAVLLAAGARLHWRVRELVVPGAAVGRADAAAAFSIQLALGAGSVALYLASSLLVYYEAELWGAALTVAAVDAVVGALAGPSARRIAWAGLLAALAVNARFSVGLAPIAALALAAAGAAASRRGIRALGWLSPVPGVGPRVAPLLAAAALVPLASYVALNEAKFGMAFGIPITKQVDSRTDANRRAVLAANHGSLFGLKYVPSAALQAIRPDAVGSVRAFPFVGLPHAPPVDVGGVRFDSREPSLSALTSMPLFCLLALAGAAVAVRRRPLRPLLGVLAGGLLAFVPALLIAYLTTRYLADLLPFLLLAALIGLQALLAACRGRPGRRRLLLGGVAALTAAGFAIDGGAGLTFERLLNPTTPEADRAAFVRTQNDVDRLLGRRPRGVRAGAALPPRATAPPGDLFVVGPCAGLYVAGQHGNWLAAERSPATGRHRLRVRFPGRLGPDPEALLSIGAGRERLALTVAGARGRAVLSLRVGGGPVGASAPLTVPRGPVPVVLSLDPLGGAHFAAVRIDGRPVLTVPAPYVPGAPVRLGAEPQDRGVRRFSGTVAATPESAAACRALVRRARLPVAAGRNGPARGRYPSGPRPALAPLPARRPRPS